MVTDYDDPFNPRPEHFTEAAEQFLRLLPADLPIAMVADTLARLCDAGHFISPVAHQCICDDYAARLDRCESAADELYDALHGGGEGRR